MSDAQRRYAHCRQMLTITSGIRASLFVPGAVQALSGCRSSVVTADWLRVVTSVIRLRACVQYKRPVREETHAAQNEEPPEIFLDTFHLSLKQSPCFDGKMVP